MPSKEGDNIYYVYLWYIVSSNIVFYIGKGRGRRYKHGHARNKQFMNIYNANKCDVVIIANGLSENEAFTLEKEMIALFKSIGEAACNITDGGPSGGNVMSNWSEEQKKAFSEKMKIINKKRCNTEEFKEKARKRMTEKYKDQHERDLQAKKQAAFWNDDNKSKQSELIKQYYKDNPSFAHEKAKKLMKPCILTDVEGKTIEFESVKQLFAFLKSKYDWSPSRKTLRDLIRSEKPYKSRKNTRKAEGIIIRYKDVETIES